MTTRMVLSYLSPLAAECVSGCAGGGSPEYTQGRNVGSTDREKHRGAVQDENGSGRADDKVNMRLPGSGGDENDDGHECEKMGNLSLPGDLISVHRSGSHGGNTNKET